ncbi:MAG TPA: hypothetical protein VFS39_09935 [Nitrospira sp.]|nr:hypothetical protein [Nitrospira sp.]
MDSEEQRLRRVIATVSQSDPLIKLLQQVESGRMKPTDAGLRAVTESWLATYQKTISGAGLSRQALQRVDPSPRIAKLVEVGVLSDDHPAVTALRAEFEKLYQQASG